MNRKEIKWNFSDKDDKKIARATFDIDPKIKIMISIREEIK